MATNVTLLKYMIICFISAAAAQLTDEEYHRLPKLYHLDDYERCLSQKTGVYCLGTFELTADQNHTVYQLMQKHTNQRLKFNRTLLHRGYCVSDRCPLSHSSLHYERNATLRFERCVAKHALRHSLVARLSKLEYCTTHRQHQDDVARAPDAMQQMFLYAVYFILFLNVVVTLYDVYFGCGTESNSLFMVWSIPSNWRRLIKIEENETLAALAPLNGVRLAIQWTALFAHACYSHFLVHVYNVEVLEELLVNRTGTVFKNGIALIQVFTLMSCFLTAYSLLLTAKTQNINARTVCKWILKRLFRILPVYLLVVGYAATWWPRAGDGPMWSAVVGAESAICRNKFWYQVFFISNLVDASELCIGPSWAIAVDIQLYLLSIFIVLLFMKLRVKAQPILAGLFVVSIALNTLLAYIGGWVPMVKIMYPENMRVILRINPSFTKVHISPWCNIPTCFVGLYVAYYYYEQKNRKDKKYDNKKENTRSLNDNDNASEKTVGDEQFGNDFGSDGDARTRKDLCDNYKQCKNDLGVTNEQVQNELTERKCNETENYGHVRHRLGGSEVHCENRLDGLNKYGHTEEKREKPKQRNTISYYLLRNAHIYVIPSLIIWSIVGSRIDNINSKLATAIYVGFERVLCSTFLGILIIELCTYDSFMRRLFAWRGWHVVGRLAFTSTMLHWCVNMTIVAGRPHAIASSVFFISLDWIATIFYSYLLSLPVCLFVEIPMRRFLNVLCF